MKETERILEAEQELKKDKEERLEELESMRKDSRDDSVTEGSVFLDFWCGGLG